MMQIKWQKIENQPNLIYGYRNTRRLCWLAYFGGWLSWAFGYMSQSMSYTIEYPEGNHGIILAIMVFMQ